MSLTTTFAGKAGAASSLNDSRLRFYWKGASTADSGPNAYTLTQAGTVDFATDNNQIGGKVGRLQNANYLTLSNAAGPNVSVTNATAITVAILWKLDDITVNQQLAGKGGNLTREWRFTYASGSGVFLQFGDGVTGTGLTQINDYDGGTRTGNPAAGQWCLNFFWHDPNVAGPNGTGYCQGALIGTHSTLRALATVTNTVAVRGVNAGQLQIGGAYGTSLTASPAVNCNIGFLAVWAGLTTQAERQAALDNIIAGLPPF
jgi:hypothetical protein